MTGGFISVRLHPKYMVLKATASSAHSPEFRDTGKQGGPAHGTLNSTVTDRSRVPRIWVQTPVLPETV